MQYGCTWGKGERSCTQKLCVGRLTSYMWHLTGQESPPEFAKAL